MTPNIEGIQKLLEFLSSLSLITGLMTWRRGGPREDEAVILAANEVLDTLSDSDKVGKIDLHTGRNVREQITIEQAEELHKEREYRKWQNRS